MVTYETIASQFDAVSDKAWILTGYNLGYCIALPVYGKTSDTYGHKAPLAASYALFSIGILFSGAGLRLWHVIVGRIITGLGGAGIVALISVVITDSVPPNQVALVRSFVNAVNVSGRAFGGPLGAFIADAVGWRWSFLVQAPTTLFCGVLFITLWSTSQPSTSNQAQDSPSSSRIDYLGIACFAVTITSLLASIELWGKGDTWHTWILLLLALIAGLLFIIIEAYHAEQPLIPLSFLKTTSSIYFLIQILLLFGRQAHVSSLSPYFLWTREINLTTAAIHLIPSPIGFTVGSIIAGLIIQRSHRYNVLCISSTILGVLVYLLITIRWGVEQQLPWEWLYSLPAGLSLGVVLACTFTALTVSADHSFQGTAICLYYLSQQVGGIIGTAVSTVAFHSTFESALMVALDDIPNKVKVSFLKAPRTPAPFAFSSKKPSLTAIGCRTSPQPFRHPGGSRSSARYRSPQLPGKFSTGFK
ncbi:hypothetical protein RJ55_04029 [Drechmeria coniospora]|nr:hypothetical protein RJ55_04029 [Drechmeria coniospora]